jgi:molybdenum cofactor biosynthesis enzyme MoaA
VGVIKPVSEDATCAQCDRYRFHAALSEARRLPACARVPHRSQPHTRTIPQGQRGLG